MDLPRSFTIREASHRIHNPFTPEKLATLGAAIALKPGMRLLDLACGSGEMLCTWARDHGVTGIGVDISRAFLQAAQLRADELEVAGQVVFEHADAKGYVVVEAVDVAACLGATWIGDGVEGTIALLADSLHPDGLVLVGQPFWRADPPDQATVEGCWAASKDDFTDLPGLVARFGQLGWDVVEMVLADEDSWDRYVAAQWFSVRTWLDEHPEDELAAEMRAELDEAPLRHVKYIRPYLGWGVFALRRR